MHVCWTHRPDQCLERRPTQVPVEYEISAGVWHDRCVRLESELLAFGSLEVVCVVGARIGRIQFERKSVGADVVRMAGYEDMTGC